MLLSALSAADALAVLLLLLIEKAGVSAAVVVRHFRLTRSRDPDELLLLIRVLRDVEVLDLRCAARRRAKSDERWVSPPMRPAAQPRRQRRGRHCAPAGDAHLVKALAVLAHRRQVLWTKTDELCSAFTLGTPDLSSRKWLQMSVQSTSLKILLDVRCPHSAFVAPRAPCRVTERARAVASHPSAAR